MASKQSDLDLRLAARLAAGLDPNLPRPIALQLADLVFAEILDGTLATGARLPTVRALAIDLALHPGVIEKAFAELERRGVLQHEAGGVFVRLGDSDSSQRARALDQLCVAVAEQARERGFGLDELIDGLIELRADRRARRDR